MSAVPKLKQKKPVLIKRWGPTPQWAAMPDELKAHARWVVWKAYEKPDGKVSKQPFSVTGHRASNRKPEHWSSFEAARRAYDKDPEYSGVGFVLTPRSEMLDRAKARLTGDALEAAPADVDLTVLDLDKCVEGDGQIHEWADDILTAAASYAEKSPSEHGLRVVLHGDAGAFVKNGVECYTGESTRFVTVTGHTFEGLEDVGFVAKELMDVLEPYRPTRSEVEAEQQERVDNPPEQIEDICVQLVAKDSAFEHYDDWLWLGMALHFQFDGGYEGQRIWDKASEGLGNYDADELEGKYESFGGGGGRLVTLKTFWQRAAGLGIKVATATTPATADDFPDLDLDEELPGLDEVAVEDVEEVKTPFPVPPGRVGLLAGEIHKNLIRPQPSYAIATALVAASMATRNRFVTGLMGTGLNLYTVQVGPTSAGKDGPRSEVMQLMNDIGMGNATPEGISSGAALIRTVAEEKVVMYLPDEFGLLLQVALSDSGPAHQKDLIAEIMRFYTKARGVHGGKRYAKSSDSIEPIKQPFVSMMGSTTPTELAKALHQGHVENGLLNRILYAGADQELPRKSRDGRPGYSAPLVMWLRSLTGAAEMPDVDSDLPAGEQNLRRPLVVKDGKIPFTPEAEQLFDAFDQESDRNSVSGELGPLWNRAHENALRVAGIVALGMDTVQVDREVAQWAVGYVRHSVELMVRYVEENVADSKFDEQCKRAAGFIKKVKVYGTDRQFGAACKKGLMPRGKLTKLLKLPGRDVDQILDHLLVTKQIKEEKVKLGDGPKETTLYRAREV